MSKGNAEFVAFAGGAIIARGDLAEVVRAGKAHFDADEQRRLALFDDASGRPLDVDFSGTEAAVIERLARHPLAPSAASSPAARNRPGRPRLGVVSREVSLLPRHWSWLAEQRGGASATLRRLVDEARKLNTREARSRTNIDAAHRFMWDIAGNEPGFEEAARALYAHDFDAFAERISAWPAGVREQLERYVERARAPA